MKKYFLLLFIIVSNFSFCQVTSSQFFGIFVGITKTTHPFGGNTQYWQDTLSVSSGTNDTTMLFYSFTTWYYDVALKQDSTFVFIDNPLIRYGHFYYNDSVYFYYRQNFDGTYSEFWGKKEPVNVPALNNDNITISVFPCPANNRLFIAGISLNNKIVLKIYNSIGEFVFCSVANDVDITNIPSGIYYAKIQQNDKEYYQKIIIQH